MNIFQRIKRRSEYRKKMQVFKNEFGIFSALSAVGEKRFDLSWNKIQPCLDDKTTGTEFDRHYVYHTAWAARQLEKHKPEKHTDISSSLYFAGIVSAFIPVDFYDFRPADIRLDNLASSEANLLSLHFIDNSIASLSCMHVVEHIGLGRYGDSLDPDGDLKAINELKRVLAPKGILLFVVPVGKPQIRFNAHRIYSHKQIIEYFKELELVDFDIIPDDKADGGLVHDPSHHLLSKQNYGCGCFAFRKPV